ncbi:MAG TPA: flagellar type III secretion system pore protein FliP [Planctomycetota bacterium]|nr:flagellar type III secretion system pore protein FliP [Planctomycetota bacterium]
MRTTLARLLALVLVLCAFGAAPAAAQAPAEAAFGVLSPTDPTLDAVEAVEAAPGDDGDALARAAAGLDAGRLSTAVEIAILITVLTLLPAILITVTSFTRIVIVLSFVRRALSTNELPPTQVVIGLSLFLTSFVMAPVAERIHERAWVPYSAGTINLEQAGDLAWQDMSGFLLANTRVTELELFTELAGHEPRAEDERPPLRVLVPAFVLSELKTSFQMGFLLFLPFLVIDMVVASVLLSMGMFMLPPVMVSTPFKILLFVLVDGWHLVCESLVTSFVTT